MKLAILGTGPIAMELALFFHLEGAMVRMIGPQVPGGKIARLASHSRGRELSASTMGLSPWGREFTNFEDTQRVTYRVLWDDYYSKIGKFLSSERVYVPRDLIRVQKQFLYPNEEIKGRTRLVDLFRVTYGLNASGLVDQQLAENPELADQIGPEILESLKNQVESFDDFDLVIDARGPFQNSLKMGAGFDYALNEQALSGMGFIQYGYDFLNSNTYKEKVSQKHLTIVGDDQLAALYLVLLESWLEEKGHGINIVTHHESAFANFLAIGDSDSWLQESLRTLITKYMKSWRRDCEEVEKELHKWRDLEAHMKTKVTKPEFPEPKINLYEGYTVTSVDKLTDRDQVFITLELPTWKNYNGERRELITLAQDNIISCTGFEVDFFPIRSLLRSEMEPGFMVIDWTQGEINLQAGLEKVNSVIDQVFTYFSKG